ncbi:MAG: DNA-directed RNA polymerase subunit D [Candidatus Marsarchaeota archaeon]|nr:DNA-directed RNA polymerase subunit D [Candidatus Marsarchaeota archaeon]
MKFDLIEKIDGKAFFHVKNSSFGEVNSVRRFILTSIPSFAVDEITFHENSSSMFNEFIAARLGLIPLTFEDVDYEVGFSLDFKGPGMAYSRDLKSTDKKIKVFSEDIPIISLEAGQSLKLDAVARKGVGKNHVKFQNAFASYNPYPEIKGKAQNKEETAKLCIKGALNSDLDLVKPQLCDFCGACEEGGLKISTVEGEFAFLVESYNNVSPEDVFEMAVKSLKKKGKGGEDL